MTDFVATPPMHAFMVFAAILVFKMWLTANGTGLLRVVRGVYITPEDYALVGKAIPSAPDETIERVRRAHLNDLENILPFLVVGFLYAATGPSYSTAWWLFATFTVGRILHTVFYVLGLQPWRTIAFEIGNVTLIVTIVLLFLRVL